jgi:hypothetical protein
MNNGAEPTGEELAVQLKNKRNDIVRDEAKVKHNIEKYFRELREAVEDC